VDPTIPGAEVLNPEAIDSASLARIFRDAFLDAAIDDDGEVKVKDGYTYYLTLDEHHRFIRYRLVMRCKSGVSRAAQQEYAREMNDGYIVIRTRSIETAIVFDYHLVIEGGVTKRNIFQSFKRFASAANSALADERSSNVL